jgi:paraquat-inducible protein A
VNKVKALGSKYPGQWFIPLILVVSLVCLISGIFLPVISFKELAFFRHTFSVLTGIISLFEERYYVLGIIIFFFSILFPFAKLIVLFSLWFRSHSRETQEKYLYWLGALGKWSMLDVFVVAITIVITKLAHAANASPRIGIYFFTLSIMLAIWATSKMEKLLYGNRKQ